MRRFECHDPAARSSPVSSAAAMARRGELVVFPSEHAYVVGCDAFSPIAVERLNAAKGRSGGTALPVMVGSVRGLDALAIQVTADERQLVAGYWPGPLTVVCKPQPSLSWDLGGRGDTVALRMPLHPVALELLDAVGPMAVVTANQAGGPVPLDCDAAEEQLGDAVSAYLDAGPCQPGEPSSIVDLTQRVPRLLREGALSGAQLRAVLPTLEVPEAQEASLA